MPGRVSQCRPHQGLSAETMLPSPELEHVSLQEGILKKGLTHEQMVPVPYLPTQTQMKLAVPKHRSAE